MSDNEALPNDEGPAIEGGERADDGHGELAAGANILADQLLGESRDGEALEENADGNKQNAAETRFMLQEINSYSGTEAG